MTPSFQIPKFVSRAAVGVMHKLADLQNFAVYWDCNAPLIGELSGAALEVRGCEILCSFRRNVLLLVNIILINKEENKLRSYYN